jgi:hypothetical protein
MADMEALKEQLMSMKREGRGFLCVGTDDPEEAAEIMKIAAELSQEEEEEQYEDEEDYEERSEPKKTGYVYTCNGEIYDDAAIAEMVAENFTDLAVEAYANNLESFLMDLNTDEIDYLKDGILKTLDTMKDGREALGIRKMAIRKSSWEE